MVHIDRMLRSDLLKIKRTPLLLIHIIIPLLGAGAFLAYYAASPWDTVSKVSGYLQALAIAFPTLIGIVCAMVAEQESLAGNFQVILTGSVSKASSFLSKLSLLFLLGFAATVLGTGIFGAGFIGLLQENRFDIGFYGTAACVLAGSNLILYILHLVISLRFGKGASIGLGIVESLISALLLTGLGDSIWVMVPGSWGVRWVSLWTLYAADIQLTPSALTQVYAGIWICAVSVIIALVLSCVWFRRWEGRKSED